MPFKKYIFALLFICAVSGIYAQKSPFPQIEGWKIVKVEQVYDSNNLWDLIDGAADLYLEYSFVDLNLARYTNKDSIEIKAELYKHADPLSAFGIYSQERDPSNHFLSIGLQGYDDEGILNFVDGEYYIKLSTLQKGSQSRDALIFIAGQIDKYLGKKNSMPKVLDYLPAESRIKNSEKYVSQNFLGYSFLKSVMTAKYDNPASLTAFVLDAGSAEGALKIVDELKKLPDNALTGLPEKYMYELKDMGSGSTILVLEKQFILGITDVKEKEPAKKLLEKMVSGIKQQMF